MSALPPSEPPLSPLLVVDGTAHTSAVWNADDEAPAASLYVAEFTVAANGFPLLPFGAPRPAPLDGGPLAVRARGGACHVVVTYLRRSDDVLLQQQNKRQHEHQGEGPRAAASQQMKTDADAVGCGVFELPPPPTSDSWRVTESRASIDRMLRRAAARWGGGSEVVRSFVDMIEDADALIADFNSAFGDEEDAGSDSFLAEEELLNELEAVRDVMLSTAE